MSQQTHFRWNTMPEYTSGDPLTIDIIETRLRAKFGNKKYFVEVWLFQDFRRILGIADCSQRRAGNWAFWVPRDLTGVGPWPILLTTSIDCLHRTRKSCCGTQMLDLGLHCPRSSASYICISPDRQGPSVAEVFESAAAQHRPIQLRSRIRLGTLTKYHNQSRRRP